MGTARVSFIDIFDSSFEFSADFSRLEKIVIPIIQRDYAQGRISPAVNRIRSRFLDALYQAVTKEPIVLDFIYGDIDKKGELTPLDGQQRLTTLFLLHWYAAKRANVSEKESFFLKKFSYETRYSARDFCERLADFTPTFEGVLSKEIENQYWFPLSWKKDPTIHAMLVMLDDIDEKFSGVSDLWDHLKDGAITFYFLPIRDMGLTDELYIKMNSRGKPLSPFEHFKAELERNLREIDDISSKRIIRKIDLDWTDMLWYYRDSGSGSDDDFVTDDEFLRYFKFICDILCYKNGESPQGRSDDEFDLLEMYFSPEIPGVKNNILLLEEFFDCWCDLGDYNNPADFLDSFLAVRHEVGKIVIDSRYQIDLFGDCLRNYSDKNGRIRQFPLNRIVLLYAVVTYLRNRESISEENFRRRLRIIQNLIKNSEDEISDRLDRNRIPAILEQVDSVIIDGEIEADIENNFNVSQIQEELEKQAFLQENPNLAELIFTLEDHPRLHGQISILGLDHVDYADRFQSLFTCDLDKIDCALMAIGDYGQMERNKWRYQYASSKMAYAWDELFHKSANIGYENTKEILCELLSRHETFTNEILQAEADVYVKNCEENHMFPWRYYYIKYQEFRPGSYGKYANKNIMEKPYLFSVMQTKTQWSPYTYMPYLKVADDAHLSRYDLGQRLVYDDEYIICENNAFVRRRNEDDAVIERIWIAQNEEGVDKEDRIKRLRVIVDERYNTNKIPVENNNS